MKNKLRVFTAFSGYEIFYDVYFCENYQDFLTKTSENLFGEKPDIKKLLSNYFNIEL